MTFIFFIVIFPFMDKQIIDKDLIYNLKEPRTTIRPKEFYQECYTFLSKPEYSKIFMGLVDSILEPYKRSYIKVTPEEDVNRTKRIVKALLDTEKITKQQHYNFLRDLEDETKFLYLYDENGEWSHLNKLNTNYNANARLFSRVLRYTKTYDSDCILNELNIGSTEGLEYIVNELENFPAAKTYIYETFIKDDPELIEIIKATSGTGEDIEDCVMTELKEHGWKVFHYGGNGDLIDQRLGIDLIVRKNKEIKTVQVKAVNKIIQNNGNIQITGKFTQPYSNIDFFAFGTKKCEVVITESEVEKTNKDYIFNVKNPLIIRLK